tara:strand:- start:2629 stop:2970 length:342 start_codon:yes stop_codon:yes gene_type:complete
MYQEDAELLFPERVVPHLKGARSQEWDELVESISKQDPDSVDGLSFSLMMMRVNGCMTCHAGSHRARLGCTACAQQTIRRYKGKDRELFQKFDKAKKDIKLYLEKKIKTKRSR